MQGEMDGATQTDEGRVCSTVEAEEIGTVGNKSSQIASDFPRPEAGVPTW